MESGALRVSVCMKEYFNDSRALARLALDWRWDTVGSLEEYLRVELGVSGAFVLVCEGHWLPPAEPLRPLLRDGDTLVVTPQRQSSGAVDGADDVAKLEIMKEKALTLLQNVTEAREAKQHKRKRIRKRPHRTMCEPLATSISPTRTHAHTHTRFSETEPVDAVMRNCHGEQQGRLVHALPHNGGTLHINVEHSIKDTMK